VPRAPYFRFWAEDSASAAQILALLPTRQTIEFESELQETQIDTVVRAPVIWIVALCVLISVAGVARRSGYWPTEQRGAAAPAPAATSVLQATPARPTTRPPAASATEDALLARQDLLKYGDRIQALRLQFAVMFNALMDGTMTQAQFADELQQWLLPQWNDLELQLRRRTAAPGSLQESGDDHLMAVRFALTASSRQHLRLSAARRAAAGSCLRDARSSGKGGEGGPR
jgi:hypothetical protein